MSSISSSWSCCTCLWVNWYVHDLHEWLVGFVLKSENLCLKFIFDESTVLTQFGQILSATSFVSAVVDDEFGEVGLAVVKTLVGRH